LHLEPVKIFNRPGLEITTDHQSIISKKLLMISGKAGFPTWKSRESHACRSPWSGTLGTLFQALTDKFHVDSMCLYTVCIKHSIGIIECTVLKTMPIYYFR
jgi:hypothetical protein